MTLRLPCLLFGPCLVCLGRFYQSWTAGSGTSHCHRCHNSPPAPGVVMLDACQAFWQEESRPEWKGACRREAISQFSLWTEYSIRRQESYSRVSLILRTCQSNLWMVTVECPFCQMNDEGYWREISRFFISIAFA